MSIHDNTVVKKKKSILLTILKIVIPLVITIGLCYMLFTGIDFKEMIAIIKRDCNFRWILLALAISIFSHVVRAARWKIQLEALGCHVSLWYLTLSVFGTYAVNLVFPRLGEVWRSGYVAHRSDKPFATIFGSMICERMFDTLTVLTMTVVTFFLATPAIMAFLQKYPEVYEGMRSLLTSPWVWCAVFLMLGVVIYLLKSNSQNVIMMKIRTIIHELWQGFAVIVKMPHKAKWLFLTLALWGFYFLQLYVCFYAFPFSRELLVANGPIVALVCFVLSSIAMAIPSNGGIGPWQIAVIFGMTIYMPAGLSQAGAEMFRMNATAFSNLVMGAQTLLLILLGIFTFTMIALGKKYTHLASGREEEEEKESGCCDK
ncbi:MAG: flippase-like domain-containing protein [Muribaculaceae bacterium]|nr:flippase-like domain-containing protein [Muribaculaceae bacterium]